MCQYLGTYCCLQALNRVRTFLKFETQRIKVTILHTMRITNTTVNTLHIIYDTLYTKFVSNSPLVLSVSSWPWY